MQLLTRDLGQLCELHVVTHRSHNERRLEGCTLHYIKNGWLPWGDSRKEFLRLLDEVVPDVVHVNCCWTPLCAMVVFWTCAWRRVHGRRNTRVVYTPHGMLEPWILRRHYWTRKLPAILLYQRKALGMADMLHATAESERANLKSLGWNDRVCVIGNCVDVDAIAMKESWRRRRSVLFLSRVHVKKGINFLIEAVAHLKAEMEGYRVIIAGPGDKDYVDELTAMAARAGVADIVTFAGPVFGDAKYGLYREADVFVLPTHSENFGIVVTESLACGTPVITTKGTPWEELESWHCGWWTEIGTMPTEEALREFLSLDETTLEMMGRNGRRLVEERYSCKRIAKEFMERYEETLRDA